MEKPTIVAALELHVEKQYDSWCQYQFMTVLNISERLFRFHPLLFSYSIDSPFVRKFRILPTVSVLTTQIYMNNELSIDLIENKSSIRAFHQLAFCKKNRIKIFAKPYMTAHLSFSSATATENVMRFLLSDNDMYYI
jgi:hypothetical protein